MTDSNMLCFGDNFLAYTKLEIIGRGGFGLVWKASRKSSGKDIPAEQNFAVKEIHLGSKEIGKLQDSLSDEAFIQRWKSLFDLKHPNILRYYQFTIEKSPFGNIVNLVTELMADGDLDGLLSQLRKKETTLELDIVLHMTEQLTFGLDYLHQSNIIHGDLKPANVLKKPCSRRRWTLVIADLDDRIKMEANVTRSFDVTQIRGTARYMSPEMVARFVKQGCEKPGRKTDVWSLGCIVLDLVDCLYGNQQRSLCKKRLFSTDSFNISADTTREQIIIKIAEGYFPVVSPEIPNELADLIGSCLVRNATERTSADALLLKTRLLLYKAINAKSSALFREVYHVAEDDFLQHAESDDNRLFDINPIVWTWGPTDHTIASVERNHILVKHLEFQAEKLITFPAAPKFSEEDEASPTKRAFPGKDYKRRNCLLLSFNQTANFVCAGFEFGLPPVTVLEMWKLHNMEFVKIDAIASKSSFFINWSSQWTEAGTCFAAVSINSEEWMPCLYVWTITDMRFREITSNTPFRVVQWFFVDGCTLYIYGSNADCYVCHAFTSTELLKRKHSLDAVPPLLPVQHNDFIRSNPDTDVTHFALQKGNLMLELVVDKTIRKQACIFRLRKGQDGYIETEASLNWPYAAVVHCTGNDSSGGGQISVACFCLRLPESKNADHPSQFHLWMWRERRNTPALLSVDLADGSVQSVSPDNTKIVAIVKMAAAEHGMPALAIWDMEIEGILWIISLPTSYHPFSDLRWNPGSCCIAFTAWSKSFDKVFSRKRLLVLDLNECEHGMPSEAMRNASRGRMRR